MALRGGLELGLALALGAANVVSELAGWGKALVVVAGVVIWGAYLGVRVRRQPEAVREWGFRADNLVGALRVVVPPTAIAAAAMVGAAWRLGNLPLPDGLWPLLALYPVWGVAQQFLLNAVVVRNLASVMRSGAAVLLGAALFAASHAPDWPVVALTFPAGAMWGWLYRRQPNLWVLGVAHALLGALAFAALLGRDPLGGLAP